METVEKEVIGGHSTCWCSHRRNWVAHNLCEARSTLNSQTSPTGVMPGKYGDIDGFMVGDKEN